MEELGRGAFGKVHKAILREMPKVEVFFKAKEERIDINEERMVAVKLLHGQYTSIHLLFSDFWRAKIWFDETIMMKTTLKAEFDEYIIDFSHSLVRAQEASKVLTLLLPRSH